MDKTSKKNLIIIIAIILAVGAIFFAINFAGKSSSVDSSGGGNNVISENADNVSMTVDGKQVVEINAKGGFSPVHSIAKAGLPTILRVKTSGTFDCSSSIRIPEMNISKSLPISGSTDIDIGVQVAGTFQGTCGMGMYPFDIKFE
jgi:hypothetical protein